MLPLMQEMDVGPSEMHCDRAVNDATIAALTASMALDSAMKRRNGPTSLRVGLRGRT